MVIVVVYFMFSICTGTVGAIVPVEMVVVLASRDVAWFSTSWSGVCVYLLFTVVVNNIVVIVGCVCIMLLLKVVFPKNR